MGEMIIESCHVEQRFYTGLAPAGSTLRLWLLPSAWPDPSSWASGLLLRMRYVKVILTPMLSPPIVVLCTLHPWQSPGAHSGSPSRMISLWRARHWRAHCEMDGALPSELQAGREGRGDRHWAQQERGRQRGGYVLYLKSPGLQTTHKPQGI